MKTIPMMAALTAATMLTTTSLHASPNPYRSDVSTVSAHSIVTYNSVIFNAGARARVAVEGDGDTTLFLRVYDENGHYIDGDQCRRDACVATWVPEWTGRFIITVENAGPVYNKYAIATE
jgi:hypothetical protein